MASTDKYADIIDMPHHVSRKHPHMSNYDRAAQFSPFAALTGHDAAVKETARLTDSRIELDESEKNVLNDKLQYLQHEMYRSPETVITYFEPDIYKEGGAYVSKTGVVKKIDIYRKVLIFQDRTEIKMDDITGIEFI